MDIKEKIEELLEKITADDGILAQFKENPIKTVEDLLGIDLPDEKIKEIVAAIKTKLDFDQLDDKFDDLVDGLKGKLDMDVLDDTVEDLGAKLGGLFGKKK